VQTAGPGANIGDLKPRESSDQQITVFINVPFLDDYARQVEELGGEVLGPKVEVPNMGYFVTCRDPEGNLFGIWESELGRMPMEDLPATPPVETEFLSPNPEEESRPSE
jgi:hypothetical protein